MTTQLKTVLKGSSSRETEIELFLRRNSYIREKKNYIQRKSDEIYLFILDIPLLRALREKSHNIQKKKTLAKCQDISNN